MAEQDSTLLSTAAPAESAPGASATAASAEAARVADDATVQDALARLAARSQRPGELKWRLTSILYPAILLIFVALYVSSLASGVAPEMGLLQAGGASLVLALLAKVAVGILADETRLVLSDNQIVAMARSGSVRDYLAKAGADSQATAVSISDSEQPPTAVQAAGTGEKE